MILFYFVVGLIFLVIGADLLVKGASRLAVGFNISPLIIGLTVVAFGTSSPELAVSVKAALSGQASIAVGNVVGSNIFNVLFILGLSAMITPLLVSRQLIRLDVPLMIAVSLIVLFLSLDGSFSRINGILLVTGLIAYILFLIFQSRRDRVVQEAGAEPEPVIGAQAYISRHWLLNILFVAGGLILLVIGSRWLVDGAVAFAQYLGVSELIIGLTIVAAGTSLPEVVTSIIAALRGERDIAVGNVVGSNIFNLMGVLGIASIVAPGGIEMSSAVVSFDIPIMVVVAFACLPIFFTGGVISRMEGFILFAYYIVYTLYLILASTQHDALAMYSSVLLYFVIPLTVVTMLVIATRKARRISP